MFDEKHTNDAEFNILAMFVFYEKLKGEKSFWFPYFSTITKQITLFEWMSKDLALIEDKQLLQEFEQL